jgi:DNA-binding XRE family transcriptional regulator
MTVNKQLPLRIKNCGISSSQLRAARGMIDWSRGELAKEAGLSAETIKNIEHGVYSPKEETNKTLIEVFARHGIRLFQQEATVSDLISPKQSDKTLTFSHAGVVRVTVFEAEHTEKGHE